MRIVFVGGGTGGHFYPLIAIAEAIRKRDRELGTDSDLLYLGPNTYNKSALDAEKIRFVRVPAGKRRLYFSWHNFVDPFVTIFGVVVAFWKLLWIYPDVVMSKGGFTSVPVVIAAWLLRIPIVIHESDSVPGRANKLAKRFARYIGIVHDDVAKYFSEKKVALVGMPMRQSFFKKVSDPYQTVGIPKDKPVILFTGGSLGAERINNFVLSSLSQLLPHYTVLHQAGDSHIEQITADATTLIEDQNLLKNYFVFGHMAQEQFAAAMQAANLIVTRAGSTSLSEISLMGKPSIVIPIPEDVSRDQRSNAYSYARNGGAVVLEEENLSDDILVAEINRILGDKQTYEKMSQSAKGFTSETAAYTLADTLRDIATEHE